MADPAPRVLITGCGRGIGLALALKFAREGCEVFATARKANTPLLRNAADEFPNLRALQLDVLDDHSVATAAAQVASDTGALDILVNNAAVFPGEGTERLHELDLSWFAEAIETNVAGVARVTRDFLPLLRKGVRPRIANISSGAGSISDKDDHSYYAYSVSKAGLNMLTRAVAAEFRAEGIVITAFSPGWVKTEMGGPNAPLTTDESADSLYAAISALTSAETSYFLDRDGKAAEYGW